MDKPIYLYITRHGETLFNVKAYAQGWCDSPLTEEGILSAKRLGEDLRKIISSLMLSIVVLLHVHMKLLSIFAKQ